jgi:hypothetical protein
MPILPNNTINLGKNMEKETIIKILEDWNFWHQNLDTGIKRNFYLKKIKTFIENNQIVTIIGARKSGKSFIMRQTIRELMKRGVEKKEILMINFEDPRFTNLNVSLLQKIYETYLEFFSPQNTPYIFLDEIQEVDNWQKWVLSMQEMKKAHIIISGSNAKLLGKELSTLLTGLHLDITVFPLSFKEFLNFNNVDFEKENGIIPNEIKIKSLMRKYMEIGGFPKAVLEKNGKEILLTYFKDILEKDIIKRHRIRKTEEAKKLINFYFSNISSLITFNSLEKSIQISADTIEKFSDYFEKAYLLFYLKRFSFKVKEQEKSPRKVYTIDGGLSNIAGFRFSENLGKLIENIVFLELQRKKISTPDLEIYYWKNERHQEVDFVIKSGKNIKQLIQACWNLSDIKTEKREINSLLKAMEELNINQAIIINSDLEKEEKFKNKTINFIPLWKWLLEE